MPHLTEPHLTEDEVLQAARGGRGPGRHADGLPGTRRAHLNGCASCADRVSGTRNLADALRAAEPEVRPPSFDALIAPALAAERAAPAAESAPPTLTASGAARLAATLVLRQARLVPASLWPLTAAGIAVLFVFAWQAPDPSVGAAFFGPAATLLTTGAALAVCSPRRDPRSEMLHAMRVPPAVVWLARLVLVLGAVLAALAVASAASAAVLGAPQDTAALIASWLGPAALGVGMTVFGTVWRSPAVGAAFGAGSWFMSVLGSRGAAQPGSLPSGTRDTIGALWSTTPLSLAVSAVLLAAAVWLVSRPDRSLGEG
ncbi:hypothetical protein CLV63_102352 [Murinocardiopsis flavida]|uniref:Uncharacterized protein n=1 Tax=Murinocardiopsis flavida TaxID=645275 RepID=A0A2P8DSQ5_9ACTN|nr:hypothetical protein [Murinocardiopsis flavida]PSL00225.1 hypothetical protein CLV63_102352 [Murinocardiopsis flavida]